MAFKSVGTVPVADFKKASKIFSKALKNDEFRENLMINVQVLIEQLENLPALSKQAKEGAKKAAELRPVLEKLRAL